MGASIEFMCVGRFSYILYLVAILIFCRGFALSMYATIVASRLVYGRLMGRIVAQYLCAFVLALIGSI